MSTFSRKNGMTLVEGMIYVALLTLVLFVITETLTTIVRTYREVSVIRTLNLSGRTAMDSMVREIRNATSVSQAQSVLGSHPGKLTIVSGPTTTEFFIEAGRVAVKENGVHQGFLISERATTSKLIFRLTTTSESSAIKIEMTLQGGTSSSFRSYNFYNSAVLRNSY